MYLSQVWPSELVYHAPEGGAKCLPTMFGCGSGECIHRIYQGDGHRDCGDGSDESFGRSDGGGSGKSFIVTRNLQTLKSN